ncbi:MAG: hypothetical protein ACRC33_02015, partial [Gemmataceae bacterium]
HRWSLREPRREAEVLEALPAARPGVLVVRVGSDLEGEFGLIDRVTWLHPEADVVAVLEGDAARLEGLAWDLGVRFALTPPRTRDDLPEVVVGLMQRGRHAAGG